MVVDRNSKQRSIVRATIRGKTLCEFRSTHEEIDVTSRGSSCDDAMLHATAFLLIVTGCMNVWEDFNR